VTRRTATDAHGNVWRVDRRLWRWPRWRRKNVDASDVLDLPVAVGDGLEGIALGIGVVVLIAVAITVVIALLLPAILFVAELAIAVALVGWRAARGRWTIVAESGDDRLVWSTTGGRASRRMLDEVVTALAAGAALPLRAAAS